MSKMPARGRDVTSRDTFLDALAKRQPVSAAVGKLQNPLVGDVWYVDHTNGSDSNTGYSWDEALATITQAHTNATTNNNDYIVVRDSLNYGSTSLTISKSQLHIIGEAYLANPYYPEKTSIYQGTAGDTPMFNITGGSNEIAGFVIDSRWTSATRTGAGSKVNLAAVILDGDSGGFAGGYNWIHNCRFPVWYGKTGIDIVGGSYNVIEDCDFEDFSTYCGIYMNAAVRNPTHNVVRRCTFKNVKYGIEHAIGTTPQEHMYIDNYMSRANTGAIYLGTGSTSQRHVVKGLYVSGVTAANVFKGLSACATIANCTTNYATTVADVWGNDGPLVA